MTDLQTLVLRGAYSTIRAEHEDSKKPLANLCEELMSFVQRINKCGQQEDAAQIDEAIAKVEAARSVLDLTESHLLAMKSLAKQRAELKKQAWQ